MGISELRSGNGPIRPVTREYQLADYLGLAMLGLSAYAAWTSIQAAKRAAEDRQNMLDQLATIKSLVSGAK